MKKALFIFNMRSGKGMIKSKVADVLDILVKAGYEVTAHPTQESGDAVGLVEERAAEFQLVVCSGGDGTLDQVVTGMIRGGHRVPIGYIPTGSTNDFGATLKIPKNIQSAADIAANGDDFACDIGSFNDDSFIYIAAFGLFTDISYATSQNMKNAFGHAAYLFELGKQFGKTIPGYQMQVEINGEILSDRFSYGMITNSSSVAGIKDLTGKDVDLSDGLLEVTLVREPKNPLELNEILTRLANLIPESKSVYAAKTDHLILRSEEPLAWTVDGEYGGTFKEVEICCKKQAVDIRVRKKK